MEGVLPVSRDDPNVTVVVTYKDGTIEQFERCFVLYGNGKDDNQFVGQVRPGGKLKWLTPEELEKAEYVEQ